MNKKNNIFRWIAIITVLVLATIACGTPSGPSSRDLNINVSVPSKNLNIGDSFNITLSVKNTGIYNLDITQIQLPQVILKNATLVSAFPSMDISGVSNTQNLISYSTTLAPNGEQTLSFTLKADKAGDLSGTGNIVSNAGTTNYQAQVVIEGSTVDGWSPGPSAIITPAALGAIPYQAVVQISALVEVDGRELIGWTGSGTILTVDGLILTNAHVVLSDRFYTVKDLIISMTVAQDSPPVMTYLASILQVDADLDIAVIKVRSDLDGNPIDTASLNLPAVPLGDSDGLQLGDAITIIGYPGIGGETVTLTRGEVSGFTSEVPYGNRAFVKTSATIAGGNSGGLAANAAGEIIGIPTQVGSGDADAGFVDCRPLADTNRDGTIDERDSCIPTGGFINALRPVKLAMSLIQAAIQGQVALNIGSGTGETYKPSGEVDFYDDFSDPNSGWYIGTDENGGSEYLNGEMVLEVKQANWLIWTYYTNDSDNIVLAADARVIRGVGDGDFGFICGLVDNNNFTGMEISEDGYFTIWKYKNDEYEVLVEWTYSDEIAAGGPFYLAAFCGSQKLALAVNDTLLVEIKDPSFVVGDVGLLTGAYDTAGTKVGFDNFQLMQP